MLLIERSGLLFKFNLKLADNLTQVLAILLDPVDSVHEIYNLLFAETPF